MNRIKAFWTERRNRALVTAGVIPASLVVWLLFLEGDASLSDWRLAAARWALGAAGFVLPIAFRKSARMIETGISVVVGVAVGATIWVFIVGPGNLWPIAIAFVVWSAGVPAIIGTGAVVGLDRVWRRAVSSKRG